MATMAKNDDFNVRKGWRPNLWTIVAPVCLLVIVLFAWNRLEAAGVVGDSQTKTVVADDKGSTAKTSGGTTAGTTTAPRTGRKGVRVKPGDTPESIAKANALTVEQLEACNKQVSDFRTLQVGSILVVDPARCAPKSTKDAASTSGR